MKKHIVILFFAMLMTGLSAYQEKPIKFLPTSLRVTVLDELGNPIKGAEVVLFKNKEDYKAETNPLAQKITDAKGEAHFKKLEPVRYFVLSSLDDRTNVGLGVQTDSLIEGRVNTVNTVIQ